MIVRECGVVSGKKYFFKEIILSVRIVIHIFSQHPIETIATIFEYQKRIKKEWLVYLYKTAPPLLLLKGKRQNDKSAQNNWTHISHIILQNLIQPNLIIRLTFTYRCVTDIPIITKKVVQIIKKLIIP